MARELMFPIRLSREEKRRLQTVADELERSKAESIRLLVDTAHRVWHDERKREEENDD